MIGSPEIRALTGRPFATIPRLWSARVERTPDAPFLLWDGRTWSYRDAWREIEERARAFAALGVGPGTRVCGLLANSPNCLWSWFGALRAGASYVALNPALKGVLLADRFRASRASLLVTDTASSPSLADMDLGMFSAVVCTSTDGLQVIAAKHQGIDVPLLPLQQLPDDPFAEACVIGTSGSTGHVKLVRLSHAALTHGAARVADAWALTPADVFHGWLPHFHCAGQLNQTLPVVVAGGRLALFPTFSASRFWQQIRDVGATVVIGLPNVVSIMWQRPVDPALERSTLRLWVTGAMDASIHEAFERRFGLQVLEQYGMTEAELLTLPRFGERFPLRSCGRPGPDWELQIADDDGCPVPAGMIGQIQVRPRQPGLLMLGYDQDDAATAAALRNAWFHCGDLGYRDAHGFVYFVERRKYVIRRRGENIASSDIERAVALHPAVAECAAVGVPSELGEQDVKIVVEPRAGLALTVDSVQEFCAANLPKYMMPRYIEIMPQLPRTSVGKVDKEKLTAAASPSSRA
jgi:crotonobetaine/carnitine-CoA ligase